MTGIDLNFISQQLERVLAEQASMRDDLLVLGARMGRVEAGVAVIAAEVHALGNQFSRRVEKLEAAR
jgi:phage-related minor tail protein